MAPRKPRAEPPAEPPSHPTLPAPPTGATPTHAATLPELAAVLGVSLQTANIYRGQGAPEKEAAGWPVEAWRAWRAENRPAVAEPSKGTRKKDRQRLLKAQADEREEKARIVRLERQELEGLLVRKDSMRDRDVARVHAVKRGLQAIPRTWPARLVGLTEREMRLMLEQEVRRLLERFQAM